MPLTAACRPGSESTHHAGAVRLYHDNLARKVKQTERFRILDKQVISETETQMRIESVGESNEHPVLEQWAQMIKVGSDWKFEGWVGN
jgi:hypothetical protein